MKTEHYKLDSKVIKVNIIILYKEIKKSKEHRGNFRSHIKIEFQGVFW